MSDEEEFLVDFNRTTTIRQMSEEALDNAIEADPNNPFVEAMEDALEEKGFLTERQRATLREIAKR